MVYDWPQLGIKEITNHYFYGSSTTLSDIFGQERIRSGTVSTIQVNQASFMEIGPVCLGFAVLLIGAVRM